MRRTNGERTRRWALERRKIHISSTALVPQRPPAHFPRRRSRAPRSAAASRPRPPRRRARRAPQRRASSSLGRRWTGAGARTRSTPGSPPRPRGRLSLGTGLHGCIGAGDSRMLGTVKMEGHESSDWNSYYADTQEVRGGSRRDSLAAGPGRPGGRAAGGLGTPPPGRRRPLAARPGWPRPEPTAPRGRPGLGARRWERAGGLQGILGCGSTRPGSIFLFRVESPSRSRPEVPRVGGWARVGAGGHSHLPTRAASFFCS